MDDDLAPSAYALFGPDSALGMDKAAFCAHVVTAINTAYAKQHAEEPPPLDAARPQEALAQITKDDLDTLLKKAGIDNFMELLPRTIPAEFVPAIVADVQRRKGSVFPEAAPGDAFTADDWPALNAIGGDLMVKLAVALDALDEVCAPARDLTPKQSEALEAVRSAAAQRRSR